MQRTTLRIAGVLVGGIALIVDAGCAAYVRTPRRHEVGFLMGGTPTQSVTPSGAESGGGEVELQSNRTLQVYYAYRLTDYRKAATLELEVPLLAVPGRAITATDGDIAQDYSALFLMPGVKVRAVTGSRIFFTGNIGAGWARFKEGAQLLGGLPHRDRRTVNSFGLGFGAGLGIQLTSAIDVRLEVRGVGAKRGLFFDNPGEWSLNNMGFLGGDFRF